MPDAQPHRRWREMILDLQSKGERLEAIAEKHLEIPFEVRPHWVPPTLDWCTFDDSLEDFCSRVAIVAKHYGPPDKANASYFHGQYSETQSPDLVARWSLADFCEIVVRVLSPTGCKLDPRYGFIEGAATRVHPECKAVVDHLLELPEAVMP